jgi:KDO2-lipid IV(A) lauroyltransferase
VARYYFFSRKLAKRRPEFNKIGWRIEAWAIGAFIGVLRLLPLEQAIRFAHWTFATVGPRSGKRLRVMRNLMVAFPDKSAAQCNRLMKDIFGHVGVALAEIAQLPKIWNDRERRIEFVTSPEIRFVKESGTPAVLVTAHIGPWTLTNFVAGQHGFPLSIVYAPESNPYVHDMMLRLRSALPVDLLARDNSMRVLIGELSHGRTIGLGSDVRLDTGDMIPFFGHDMPTNTVPARLALRFACELVPTRAERLPGGRYRITLYPPVVADDGIDGAAAQASNMTAKLNRQFEQWIREAPGEWLCLARRWPKDVERAAEQDAARSVERPTRPGAS